MSDEVASHAGNLGGEPNIRVPVEVAEALDIEIGDEVIFKIEDDRVVLRRGRPNVMGYDADWTEPETAGITYGAPSDTAE
jgi:bifunctional DNA-binding transcriptional regulator/antitoxin component of YhaV-PrlF toxin-antitoxin module